jgi:hypothetical protein
MNELINAGWNSRNAVFVESIDPSALATHTFFLCFFSSAK